MAIARPYDPDPIKKPKPLPLPTFDLGKPPGAVLPKPLPIVSAGDAPRPATGALPAPSVPAPAPDWIQVGNGWVPPGHPLANGQTAPGAGGTAPLTLEQAERQKLIQMLSSDPSAVTIADPALKGQADAFAVGQTREAERARNMLAERRSAQGLGTSGAFDADLNNLSQQQGEAEAGFNASLVANELSARRQQLVQALTIGGGLLSEEDRNRANLQIARIDAEARKYGIDMQGKLGTGQLNLGLLQTLMQNQNFNDSLGWDMSKFQWNANDPFSAFR